MSLPKIVAKTSVELSPFSSNTFTVLGLTCKSLFFQVNFYEWYKGGGGPISFFCVWLSNFPNAIHWKDCSFLTESYGLPCQILVDCMYMCAFISGLSVLFHWPMCLFLWAFIKLKMRNCATSFFLGVGRLFRIFCASIQIFEFFLLWKLQLESWEELHWIYRW